MKQLQKDIYDIRFAIIPLIIYIIFMQIVFKTVCPFKAITKIPCPACGLTHATIYLLTGRLKESLNANPTCILWLITIFIFSYDRYIKQTKIKPFPFLFIIVSIITIIRYILILV